MNFYLPYISVFFKKILVIAILAITSNLYAQLEFRGVSPSEIVKSFEFTYTSNSSYIDSWGGDIETTGFLLEGSLELIEEDTLGCSRLYAEDLTNKIAFIYRGECSFYDKIYQAQLKGAKGVVIVNNEAGDLFFMTGGQTSYLVNIPAILISKSDGEILRNAMNDTTVNVMLRNIQDYFEYNLSIENGYSLIPNAYATPQLTITADNPFDISLGSLVINRGSIDISEARLNVKIVYEDSVLINYFVTGSVTSADTVFFDLPDASFDNLDIGKYQLIYYTDIPGYLDQDRYSDTLMYNFEITPDRYSLCSLDSLGEPVSNHYTTSGISNLSFFRQCIKFESPKAHKLAAEGLFFSVDNELGDINQEVVLISCFQWNNDFNSNLEDLTSNFSDMEILDERYVILDGDLAKDNIYSSFNHPIVLDNDTKYLFCINSVSTPDLLIGYDRNINYTLNNYAFSESVNPIEIASNMSSKSQWFNGFSSGFTPGIAINLIDSKFLGINETQKSRTVVYPNPIDDKSWLTIENKVDITEVFIHDVSGKMIINKKIKPFNNKVNIKVQGLEKGIYLVNVISNDNQVSTFNIVKQ